MPNINVVAMLVQEGGKLLSEILRIRQFSSHSKTTLLEIDKAYKSPPAPAIETTPLETSVSSSVSSETSPSKATAVETGCVPCMPPDTLILANPAVETIDEIQTKTKVLDMNGSYTPILQVMERPYDDDLIETTIPYQKPIRLTPEHPVLIIKARSCRARKRIGLCLPGLDNSHCVVCQQGYKYIPEFILASQLTSGTKKNSWSRMVLLAPRITSVHDLDSIDGVPVTPALLKLAGYYLAEGSITEQQRGKHVRFDFGKKESAYANEVAILIYTLFNKRATVKETATGLRVSISSKQIGTFLMIHFGKNSHTKKIPLWIMTLPVLKQNKLIKGYWLGDGNFGLDKRGIGTVPHLSCTTVSRSLAYGLQQLLYRLGIIHSFGSRMVKDSQINGRKIKGGLAYILQVNGPSAIKLAEIVGYEVKGWRFLQSHLAGIDQSWIYFPIKKVKRVPYQGKVMNLETESGTYCANGIIVHNCSLGHLGTCSGVLNEAMRFARKDGMNVEVVDRINICLDELNAMERVDLRPQMIENLPGWEKELATETLNESRAIRHKLESVKTVEDLEHLAAKTQEIRNKVGRKWFGAKMDAMPNMTPEIKAKVESKLDELEGARTEAGT